MVSMDENHQHSYHTAKRNESSCTESCVHVRDEAPTQKEWQKQKNTERDAEKIILPKSQKQSVKIVFMFIIQQVFIEMFSILLRNMMCVLSCVSWPCACPSVPCTVYLWVYIYAVYVCAVNVCAVYVCGVYVCGAYVLFMPVLCMPVWYMFVKKTQCSTKFPEFPSYTSSLFCWHFPILPFYLRNFFQSVHVFRHCAISKPETGLCHGKAWGVQWGLILFWRDGCPNRMNQPFVHMAQQASQINPESFYRERWMAHYIPNRIQSLQ